MVSGSNHHFMINRRKIEKKKSGCSNSFIFWGSKITVVGDCSHEIKRCLLLGRKAMTNLESVLKSKDITLPTKFGTLKAMVFPIVMYGYESWKIKKDRCQRINVFKLEYWRRLFLESLGLPEDQTSQS